MTSRCPGGDGSGGQREAAAAQFAEAVHQFGGILLCQLPGLGGQLLQAVCQPLPEVKVQDWEELLHWNSLVVTFAPRVSSTRS